MITKQGLELIIIFQVWLGKTTSKVAIQRQIKTRRNHEEEDHLKRRVFQDQSFLGSLCKVVGALGFSCITFFNYAPKSSKSYFVLNILKIGWFHVFN